MLVDDPVHELEADEGDGEDDPGVLVNVGGRDAEHPVDVLGRDHTGDHGDGLLRLRRGRQRGRLQYLE